MALPTTVPQQIKNSFAFVLSPAMQGSGAVVIVGPGRPNNPFNFPAGFENANAYDIVQSATYRGLFEQQLASAYSGATTGSSTWDDAAFAVASLALSVTQVDSATIVVMWTDGSESSFKIEAGSTHLARYQMGESRDSMGNIVPDASINNPATGGRYAGSYTFNNSNDLQNWVNTAISYGVSVTGNGTGGMSCTWDGETLTCRLAKK